MSDDEMKAFLKDVSASPSKIEWPLDRHGTTADLKKYGLAAASKIRGDTEKTKTVLLCLAILTKHVQARLKADQEFAQAQRDFRHKYEATRVERREVFTGGITAKVDGEQATA